MNDTLYVLDQFRSIIRVPYIAVGLFFTFQFFQWWRESRKAHGNGLTSSISYFLAGVGNFVFLHILLIILRSFPAMRDQGSVLAILVLDIWFPLNIIVMLACIYTMQDVMRHIRHLSQEKENE